MKSGTYIAIVVALGFILIGYLFFISPATAGAQLPLLLTALGGIIALLGKVGDIDTKVETAVTQSRDNHDALTVSNSKADKVHELVDGQMTAYKEMIERFSLLEQRLAAATGEKAGIALERQRVADGNMPPTHAVAPSDAAAIGAAKAVADAPYDAKPGETADAAARGAAEAAAKL